MKELILAQGEAGFSHPMDVRFQDVDAAGLVFYPRILEYFHDAYLAFLGAHGVDLAEVLRSGRWAAPIKHAEADFIRPLRYGDHVDVDLVGHRIDRSDLLLAFRARKGTEVCAVGLSIHAFIDTNSFTRIEIPEKVLGAAKSLNAI